MKTDKQVKIELKEIEGLLFTALDKLGALSLNVEFAIEDEEINEGPRLTARMKEINRMVEHFDIGYDDLDKFIKDFDELYAIKKRGNDE